MKIVSMVAARRNIFLIPKLMTGRMALEGRD
jgi:hypothetical protein